MKISKNEPGKNEDTLMNIRTLYNSLSLEVKAKSHWLPLLHRNSYYYYYYWSSFYGLPVAGYNAGDRSRNFENMKG